LNGVPSAAEVVGTTPDLTSALAQYGVLGIAAALLVVFARAAYKREIDRADRLEKTVFELHQSMADRYIPALQEASGALTESTRVNQEVVLALRDLQAHRDFERRLREER